MDRLQTVNRLPFVRRALPLIALLYMGASVPAAPVPLPAIPPAVFRVTDYGAVGDGKTLNTAALQKTIDACRQAGGGTALVPAGRFLTGPLTLTSRLNLRLEKGATLLLSSRVQDYALPNGRSRSAITARDCQDVSVTGEGTIDGQGGDWWPRYRKGYVPPPNEPPPIHRPYLLVFTRCQRVLVKDISLVNSPSFHLVPAQCRDVTVEGVHITASADSPNTDGMDPSGWNFLIQNCTFDVGDDCIALKPSGLLEPGQPSCQDFLIQHCVFLHGHGLSVGGQTPGGLENMTVRDCTFDGTQAGIRLKAGRGQGGLVENLTYDHLTMTNVKSPILITSYYPKAPANPAADPIQPVTAVTPIWRHIQISNLTAKGGPTAGLILGLPEMPVSDVTLTNVEISAKKGMEISHGQGIRFVHSQIITEKGPLLTVQQAEVTGLDAGNRQ